MLKLPADAPYEPCDGATLYDLHIQVENLSPCVQANLPADDPTRAAFDRYWEESERTQEPPSRKTTLAALAAFYSLSMKRQRTILNGWRPVNIIPARAELLAGVRDSTDAQRVLSMCVKGGGRIDGCQEWKLQSTSPVEVNIRAGTTKAEAVAALAGIIQELERCWPELMEDVWCLGVREEKSGASMTPLTPKLGGTKGEEARQLTAA